MTLPIADKKKVNSQEARTYLRGVCDKYGADVTYTLYMVDNEWGQENHFTLFIIRFGAAAVLFFALAVALVLASWKVSGSAKDVEEVFEMAKDEMMELGHVLIVQSDMEALYIKDIRILEHANEHGRMDIRFLSRKKLTAEDAIRYQNTPIQVFSMGRKNRISAASVNP